MDHQNTTYLDKGYLTLFANQLLGAVNGAQAIAIHSSDGRLLWEGPDQNQAAVQWDKLGLNRVSSPGVLRQIGDNHHVYVFVVTAEHDPTPRATISIFVNAAEALDFDTIHYLLKPLIQCLERQFAINAELSAIRKVSRENRDGLNLLVELDDLAKKQEGTAELKTILQLCKEHFDARVVAALVPGQSIQEILTGDGSPELDLKFCALTFSQLFRAVRKHNRILLSDTAKNHAMQEIFGTPAHVCTAPIRDEKDEIAGILILARSRTFSPAQVRLARAIGSKLSALSKQPNAAGPSHLPRHVFLYQVDSVLKRFPHSKHAMIYVDIDQLHVINDSYGHMAGDEAIRSVASIIDDLAGKDDIVGHLAGDCFALFLKESNEDKATAKAQVILETISNKPLRFSEHLIEINVSIGITLIPDFAQDSASGVNIAEIAARTAKDRGGNRFVVFQDLDASIIQRRSDLDQVGDLQAALLEDRFVLHAQKIVSLHRESSKYEILVRMLDRDGNLVSPDRFLSAAERYQMMSALDRWVLSRALEQISGADNMLEINLTTFCINISGQSLADDDFLPHVETLITESGLSPDSICFEITETAIVRNLDRAQRFIQRLRKLGCRFSLDDFGTGYCSFAYLKNLPVHYLKLDGAFIRDLLDDALSEAIVKSITQIGQVMGAATVAEHVENELVKRKLKELGVDYVQGFAIGKPKPLEEVLARMNEAVDLGLDALAV